MVPMQVYWKNHAPWDLSGQGINNTQMQSSEFYRVLLQKKVLYGLTKITGTEPLRNLFILPNGE
jgi:hypothetical protein